MKNKIVNLKMVEDLSEYKESPNSIVNLAKMLDVLDESDIIEIYDIVYARFSSVLENKAISVNHLCTLLSLSKNIKEK